MSQQEGMQEQHLPWNALGKSVRQSSQIQK